MIALGIAIGGCGPLTVHTDSPEKLNKSLTAMREPLPQDDLVRFNEALQYLAGGVTPDTKNGKPAAAPGSLSSFAPLAGLTAEAVISTAYVRRSQEVGEAIAALQHRHAASLVARDELSGFRLSKARVFKRSRRFLEWPVIELRVNNDTRHRVHLVRLHASLLPQGEAAPWVEEEIHHVVINGLAPTARDLWRIEPEQREWIQLVDPHPDVEFHLEVVELSGLGGATFVGTDWTAVDDHRLELFSATLESIKSSHRLCLDRPPRPEPIPPSVN